jgi:heat-inducible transcriptional repressor
MRSSAAMIHPAMKAIYEAMNELDTADIKVEGVNKLLKFPEYSDVSKLRDLLGVLEEKDKLLDVLSAKDMNEDGINVYIGSENDDVMGGTTLIFKNVNVGGSRVAVGVIGPKRMDYKKVVNTLKSLTDELDNIFRNDERGED